MASASCGTRTPFHRSMSYNIPRSQTTNPILDKRYATELPKRARTPLPHEEGIGYRKSTSAHIADHHRHRTHANSGSRSSESKPDTQFGAEERHDDVDFQVRMWMIQEETRRIAAAREAARTRLVQEEVKRIQEKIMMKRNLERFRISEESRLAREEEERERARRHRVAADRILANAWTIYERNWAAISSSSETLLFSSIPWPTLSRPEGPSSITLPAVSAFLLSEAHSAPQKPKERIKEALRRWHPDRFVRFLRRVPEEERSTVEEAVGSIARHLNELLSKYSD